MIKMKKFILILIFLLAFTYPIGAIDGYIQIEYDTLGSYSNGELYIYELFFENKLLIGGKFQANLLGYSKKQFIPAGIPANQTYDLIIEYQINHNWVIRLKEGCKHYFAQHPKHNKYDDTEYFNIGIKYYF